MVGGARNFIEFLFLAAVAVGLVAALIPASISSEGGDRSREPTGG
jgi:hypothetical protein